MIAGVIGPGIAGTITTTASIVNVGIDYYPYDACELPYEVQNAFPGDLATLSANTDYPFHTVGGDNAFTGF